MAPQGLDFTPCPLPKSVDGLPDPRCQLWFDQAMRDINGTMQQAVGSLKTLKIIGSLILLFLVPFAGFSARSYMEFHDHVHDKTQHVQPRNLHVTPVITLSPEQP